MRGMTPKMPAFAKGIWHRHRVMVLAAALILTSLVVTGFVWANKKVTIIADEKIIRTTSIQSNAEKMLAQAGIYLGPKDEYRVTKGQKTNDPVTIEVFRAIPVSVLYNGKTEVVLTGKPTVREVADALNIPRSTRTIPDEMTRPSPNMQVRVVDVIEKEEERELSIPRPIIRQPDSGLEKGIEGVFDEGQDGSKKALMKVRYEDGQEVAAQIVSEQIIAEPKPQIVHVGTRDTVNTYRGTLRFKKVMTMEATAYNPTDGAPHGLTASGIPARHGIVAVDPDVIPLGSRVYIPGYGLALAADTGGAILGDRIDLCMEGYEEAWSFGRRDVKVYIIAD